MAKEFHVDKPKNNYQPLSGFQSDNKYRRQKDEELAELEKELEAAEQEGQEDTVEDKGETKKAEEASPKGDTDKENWKKRYGDLRSHFSKKEQEWNETLKELQEKVEAKEVNYPTTEDEVEEWVKKYPKVAAVIQTMQMKGSEELRKEVNSKTAELQKELERERAQLQFDRAYAKLLGLHPDFPDLVNSDEFKHWLEEQPMNIQNFINNPGKFDDEAVDNAAWTVKQYKKEFGLDTKKSNKKSTTQNSKDAAKSVTRSNNDTPESDDGKPIFSESQIRAMPNREFEKLQDQILEAQKEGRFEYDISGAAR